MDSGASISPPLVAALDRAWSTIRVLHPDVPEVVITLGARSIGGASPGEGLKNGRVDLLDTLLHEAAHGVAYVRGVKDTSRQGRWHNAHFRDIAQELGLDVRVVDRHGWSATIVSRQTQATYRDLVDELTEVPSLI